MLDRNFPPSRTDNFTISIQCELSSRAILEVGYIGRLIRHEWQQINIDAVPYMTTLGGQSFAQAFNHVVLGDPNMDISDPSSFGVLGSNSSGGNGGQTNSPRQMEFGLRIHF